MPGRFLEIPVSLGGCFIMPHHVDTPSGNPNLRLSTYCINMMCVLAVNCDAGLSDTSTRVDCGYPGVPRAECLSHDCCWDDSIPAIAWCFHGSKYRG